VQLAFGRRHYLGVRDGNFKRAIGKRAHSGVKTVHVQRLQKKSPRDAGLRVDGLCNFRL
jgi:hypothetical protein